jgi:hypothetical protein
MSPKKSDEDRRVAIVGEVPAHLIQLMGEVDGAETVETMKNIRILSRLDIVQAGSPRERKEKHGEGSAIVGSTDMLVAKRDEYFDVVPVMYFDEFIAWRDRNDKGADSKIFEQTLDTNSALAMKCQNKATWKEPYGDVDPNTGRPRFVRSNTHHLTFVCIATSGVMKGQLVVFSMARGNWGAGAGWIGKIRSRQVNGKQAPLFATRWKARLIVRTGKSGDDYYGWEIDQADEPWVTPEELPTMREAHETLKADYKSKTLAVDHTSSDDAEGSEVGTSGADGEKNRRF